MVDFDSIQAAVTSLKTAADIVKSFRELSSAAEFQGKITELNAQILAAQSSALAANADQFALAQRVRDLEAELTSIKAWETEKERYQRKDFGGNTFAYVLKPGMQSEEPDHRLCSACFENKHPSTLQFKETTSYHQDKYFCPACKTDFLFGEPQTPRFQRYAHGSGPHDWMTR